MAGFDPLASTALTPPTGAAGADANPFASAVREMRDEESSALRGGIARAMGTAPTDMTEAYALAAKTGMSPWAVRDNLAAVRETVKSGEFYELLTAGKAPGTRTFFLDPVNIGMARDAAPAMSAWEHIWNTARALPSGAVEGAGALVGGVGAALDIAERRASPLAAVRPLYDLLGVANPNFEAPDAPWWMRSADKREVGREWWSSPGRALMAGGGVVKDAGAWIGPAAEQQTIATDISKGVGQLAFQVAAAVLSGGSSGAMLAMLGAQGADQMADAARKAGKWGTAEGDIATLAGAAITGATEKLALDRVIPGVSGPVKSKIVSTLKAMLAEGGQEVAEGVLQDIVKQLALDPKTKTIFDGLAGLEGKDREAIAAAGAAGIVHALLLAGGIGRNRVAGKARSERAIEDAKAFHDAAAGLASVEEAAKLPPDALKAWLANVTGPDAVVHIDAAKAREFFQSMPPEEAQATAAKWGVFDQVGEAFATGGDLVMSAADYLANVVPSGAHEALKDDIRFGPRGMTAREAQAWAEGNQEWSPEDLASIRDQAVETARRLSDHVRIHDDVFRQLTAAGVAPGPAEHQAALVAAGQRAAVARHNEALARRGEMPMTAWEYHQSRNLKVRSGVVEKVAAQAPDHVDMLLDRMRDPKMKVATKRQTHGETLLEFIARRGGIVDTGGELAAMDADKWHLAKPFRPKLVKAAAEAKGAKLFAGVKEEATLGHGLDDMALAAWEEGFFPEVAGDERPSPDQLLDAIREELAGNPRYVASNVSDWRIDEREGIEALDAAIRELGLDLAKMTNAEIKAAIDAASRTGGAAYEQGRVNTDTPEFRAWFGDSKVVDAEGKPLVVYHGTGAKKIDQFRAERIGSANDTGFYGQGFYFTPSRELAEDYRPAFKNGKARGSLQEVYVRIENPFVYDVSSAELQADTIARAKAIFPDAEITTTGIYWPQREDWTKALKAAGYDGVFVETKALGDDPPHEIIAFSPTQIKSVFNRGTFDPADPRILYQPAYHGSPSIHDRFSLDYIGSGEGAQAYGWGLYFAGRKEIAQHYRDALRRNRYIETDGTTIDRSALWHRVSKAAFNLGGISLQNADRVANATLDGLDDVKSIKKYLKQYEFPKGFEKYYEAAAAAVADAKPSKGRLYKVEIPDDGEYLLWDKKISEQPESVKAALARAGIDYEADLGPNTTGGELYRELSARLAASFDDMAGGGWAVVQNTINDRVANDKAASLALLEAGIPGIKYLDGGSRTKGDGSHNYVIFDDKLVSIAEYEQPDGSQMPRGKIAFTPGGATITLNENANLSTFLHETGHYYLETLRELAADPDASPEVKADMATLLKWFGVDDASRIGVDQHEQFAKGFEVWLSEGRAPSVELGGAFRRFAAWLADVYKSITDALGVTLNDDVRAVMSRLVATSEEIDAAQQELAARQTWASADQAGMTEAEFAEYTKLVKESREDAEDALLKKTMAEIKRRRTDEWNAELAELTEAERARIDRSPVFAALRFLQTGKRIDAEEGTPAVDVKLSADALRSMYGAGNVTDNLPKRVPPIWTNAGGHHPDAVADALGFPSGTAMVDAMMAVEAERKAMRQAGDKRSVQRARAETAALAEMKARHGDMLSDGGIQEEALAAVHNERRGDVLAAELRALGRKVDRKPSPFKWMADYAAGTISGRRIKDAAGGAVVAAYARNEAKAGRAVLKAVLAGDHEEAFRQKQTQALNHALYREADAAREEIEKARATMDRYAQARTIKSMDQGYLEQIHALLERVNVRPRSLVAARKSASLAQWLAEQEAQGIIPVIPAKLADEAQRQDYREMTVEEFRALRDTVDQIAHLGRLKKTLIVAKEKRDFDAVVDAAVDVVERTPQRGGRINRRGGAGLRDTLGIAGETAYGFDASMLKIETMIDWLDDGDPNGAFNRVVFRPIADAQAEAFRTDADMAEKFKALVDAVPEATRERWAEKVTLPWPSKDRGAVMPNTTLLRSQLIAVALNTGNESNLSKMERGEGWNRDAIRAGLNAHLTADEWAFVQGTWDLIESLWPRIEAMEKRVNGVAPPKIEALPVVTPNGTLRGGYYPVVYDPRVPESLRVRENEAKNADKLLGATYLRASTPKGYTKERVEGFAAPLMLDLDAVPRHIREVVHDLTHREAVLQANKFLSDKRIQQAMIAALGAEYQAQFQPWLQSVANEHAIDRRGVESWERFFRAARSHMTMVGMGFRVSTVLTQAAGFSDSVERIGGRWMLSGIRDFYAAPRDGYEFIKSKSAEMAQRFGNTDRDMRKQMRELQGKDGVLDGARRFAFYGISAMDMLVAGPTWMGAYNKALAEGMADADAVYAADKAVRDSQGSGHAKDLPAVQRRNEFWNWATMFYSYLSHVYQRQRLLVRDARNIQSFGDFASVAWRSWWLMVVPQIASALIKGDWPDEKDDDTWAKWAARKVAFGIPASVPMVRDFTGAFDQWLASGGKNRLTYTYSPVVGGANTIGNTIIDAAALASGGKVREGAIRRGADSVGLLLGLPTGQIGAHAQWLWDVFNDHQYTPRDLGDWYQGVLFGKADK